MANKLLPMRCHYWNSHSSLNSNDDISSSVEKPLVGMGINDVGQLRLTIFAAEGLAAADLNGKSDPFAVIRLINDVCQTSTQYKNLNPEWNESFAFKISDINACLDIVVWDEDRNGADFLGRVSIPLLKVVNGRRLWYKLKDKKLQNNAKGRILLEMSIEWSVVRASLRTFNPSEPINNVPDSTFKRTLLISNFNRLKCQILYLLSIWRYIQSCFAWESKLRSSIAFIIFLSATYVFELWMVPGCLFLLYLSNYVLFRYTRLRKLFGMSDLTEDEHQKLFITSDNQLDESFEYTTTSQHQQIFQSSKWCLTNININNFTMNSGISVSLGTSNNNNNNNNVSASQQSDQADNKSILKRIQAVQDVVILVQDVIGETASYGERLVNSFTFRVPFLSHLMMFCLLAVTILMYFVPLRVIVMLWGINKFTKKLRSPNAIDNNELIDYLSRVPDNIHLMRYHNEITETITMAHKSSNISNNKNRLVTVGSKKNC